MGRISPPANSFVNATAVIAGLGALPQLAASEARAHNPKPRNESALPLGRMTAHTWIAWRKFPDEMAPLLWQKMVWDPGKGTIRRQGDQ